MISGRNCSVASCRPLTTGVAYLKCRRQRPMNRSTSCPAYHQPTCLCILVSTWKRRMITCSVSLENSIIIAMKQVWTFGKSPWSISHSLLDAVDSAYRARLPRVACVISLTQPTVCASEFTCVFAQLGHAALLCSDRPHCCTASAPCFGSNWAGQATESYYRFQ